VAQQRTCISPLSLHTLLKRRVSQVAVRGVLFPFLFGSFRRRKCPAPATTAAPERLPLPEPDVQVAAPEVVKFHLDRPTVQPITWAPTLIP